MPTPDIDQPAIVMVPDLIPGHAVPEPPREGASLAEALRYVVEFVPREHWDAVTISYGAGAEAGTLSGDAIERLWREAGIDTGEGLLPRTNAR